MTHRYTAARIRALFLLDPTYTLTIPEIAQRLGLPPSRYSTVLQRVRTMPDVSIIGQVRNARGSRMNVYRLDPSVTVTERRGRVSTVKRRIVALLRAHPDGLTLRQIVDAVGVPWTTVQCAIHTIPDAYIDRWTITNQSAGQVAQVWCLSPKGEFYPHCPKPDAKLSATSAKGE